MRYGVMPTTLLISDHSLVQKIVALVVCIVKLNAMHDDFLSTASNLIIVWTKRFVALIVLSIKLYAMHNDFISTSQIRS